MSGFRCPFCDVPTDPGLPCPACGRPAYDPRAAAFWASFAFAAIVVATAVYAGLVEATVAAIARAFP